MFTRFTCQATVCVCRTAISMRKLNRFVDNGNSEVSMPIFPFIQPFRLYDKQSFSFYLMHSVLLKGTVCKCIRRSSYLLPVIRVTSITFSVLAVKNLAKAKFSKNLVINREFLIADGLLFLFFLYVCTISDLFNEIFRS